MPDDLPPPDRSAAHPPSDPAARTRFRTTLIRVLLVQVVALALLWLLQIRYGG